MARVDRRHDGRGGEVIALRCCCCWVAAAAEKLLVILRDGRKLIGYLRTFDQFGTHRRARRGLAVQAEPPAG